jgi:hypothetical protein
MKYECGLYLAISLWQVVANQTMLTKPNLPNRNLAQGVLWQLFVVWPGVETMIIYATKHRIDQKKCIGN